MLKKILFLRFVMIKRLKSLLQDPQKRKRFLKFGIVGGLGFLINYFSLEFFRGYGIGESLAGLFSYIADASIVSILKNPSAWSAALATEIAIISNYTLNNIWTFKEKKIIKLSKIISKFLQFNLTSSGAIIIQFIIIGFATIIFGDTKLVRLLFLIIAVAFFIVPYNWFMYNAVIWKTKQEDENLN